MFFFFPLGGSCGGCFLWLLVVGLVGFVVVAIVVVVVVASQWRDGFVGWQWWLVFFLVVVGFFKKYIYIYIYIFFYGSCNLLDTVKWRGRVGWWWWFWLC